MTNDFFKNLMQKKNWNKRSILMLMGTLGVFLILTGNLFPSSTKKNPAACSSSNSPSLSEYSEQLENRLNELLCRIDGAGKIQVAVTLESSPQTVYALDEKTESANREQQKEHIILNQQDGQDALVEMTWEPEIRGVAVVCQGADDVKVRAQITEMVSVLTGVSTNRISIAKMN